MFVVYTSAMGGGTAVKPQEITGSHSGQNGQQGQKRDSAAHLDLTHTYINVNIYLLPLFVKLPYMYGEIIL